MELSEITKKYWEEKDWEDLEKVEQVCDLFVIAERIISRMEKPLIQVCGPIGTGGLGSVEENLNVLNNKIKELQREGLNIFDQMPFEAPMQKLKKKLVPNGEYLESILTDFYHPIFRSGAITKFCFLPSWKTSKGAQWEHQQAEEYGIEIIYLK